LQAVPKVIAASRVTIASDDVVTVEFIVTAVEPGARLAVVGRSDELVVLVRPGRRVEEGDDGVELGDVGAQAVLAGIEAAYLQDSVFDIFYDQLWGLTHADCARVLYSA
jgi:hypothetical protein